MARLNALCARNLSSLRFFLLRHATASSLAGMETGLRLLMRDGTLHVAFHPKLSAEQYADLLKAVEAVSSCDDLRAAAVALAKRWGSSVEFDGC